MLATHFRPHPDAPSADTGARLVAAVLAVTIAITVTLAAYVYAGRVYALASAVTWCLALGGWLATTRRRADRPVAFDLYVGTLVALMLLYGEAWYGRLPSTLAQLFPGAFPPGVGIGEHAFVAIFPLAASAVMTLGALAHYRRMRLGELAAWTVFAWGCVAAIGVYVAAPAAGQAERYVGGMLTAPIPLVVALAGMRRLVRQHTEIAA